MANWSKQYTKTPVNITKLTLEIEDDGLTPNLVGISDDNSGSNNLTVTFDAEVTGGELTTLDATVAAHDGSAATYYSIYCYDCGCGCGARALSALTACPVCSGTDIQTSYHNDNLDATSDPTVNDDGTAGYCEGSHWINVTTDVAFICLDNATGAAVWKEISQEPFANQEIWEHFLDSLIDPPATTGGEVVIGCLQVVAPTYAKDTASIAKITTGALTGNAIELWGMKCHNPSDYTYYQMNWRWKIDSVNFDNEIMGLIDASQDEDNYCYVTKGSGGGTVKFVTVAGGGAPETTDNITCDITALHKFTIKIKSGQVKFFIDDVLKATHTTAVPYSVAIGLMFLTLLATTEDVVRDWYIDYLNTPLGRSF